MTTKTLVKVAMITALMTLVPSLQLAAQDAFGNHDSGNVVYAVVINCGFGSTMISIHNPHGRAVTLTTRGVPLEVGQGPTPPKPRVQETLNRDWALLMGCDEMAALGAVGTNGMGNVIVESAFELDVSAVYASRVAGGGVGETTFERIPPTRVKQFSRIKTVPN